jgi:hypothetical protein
VPDHKIIENTGYSIVNRLPCVSRYVNLTDICEFEGLVDRMSSFSSPALAHSGSPACSPRQSADLAKAFRRSCRPGDGSATDVRRLPFGRGEEKRAEPFPQSGVVVPR